MELKVFAEKPENLDKLVYILENSANAYAQYLSGSAVKTILSENWNKIPVEQKVAIKDYLLNFLINKALKTDKNVMKMMILLFAKICKLSWFDHPELKNMVQEVT